MDNNTINVNGNPINLINYLQQINEENLLDEKKELCTQINALYDLYFNKIIPKYVNKINSNSNLKYINSYIMVTFGYGKEIALLQQLEWNNSIQSLSRDLLECYSYAKKLISLYDNVSDFNEYIKNLILIDMKQDLKIYYALISDTTIHDSKKKDSDIHSIIVRFENLLKKYFPEAANSIDIRNKNKSIFKIIRKLKEAYDNKFPENNDKSKFIGSMLENNVAWKNSETSCYDGCYIIYRELCHMTHNSISSIQARTVRDGLYMLNNDSPNVAAALSLDYWCMRDIYEEMIRIYEKIN